MTRPNEGDLAGRDRLHTALRAISMAVAIACGLLAVWLIVTADTQKGTRVGALVGFWALLLAAYAVFGTRRPAVSVQPGSAVDLRGNGELERVESAAGRREYEYRLAEMLRREIQAAMAAELSTLRADVAALRSELVEKVGGQLRLERIETTRVIGSDIEALQHEVRQLMVSQQPHDGGPISLATTHTALMSAAPDRPRFAQDVAPGPSQPEPFVPKPGPPKPGPPRPSPPAPLPPEPFAPEPFAPQPAAPQPAAPEPITPEPRAPESPVTQSPTNGDPFASLPRLSPFTDTELESVGSQPESSAGRHASDDVHVDTNAAGGRRRRGADGDDNVLARILQREGAG